MKKYSFLQEELIGNFSQSPQFRVEIHNGDEGPIPHFHVSTKKNSGGKEIDTCIEIGDNRYFRHGIHKDTITDGKIRKQLNMFLSQKPTQLAGLKFKTNWLWIKYLWNKCDFILKVTAATQPDYSYIKPEIKNDPRLKNLRKRK